MPRTDHLTPRSEALFLSLVFLSPLPQTPDDGRLQTMQALCMLYISMVTGRALNRTTGESETFVAADFFCKVAPTFPAKSHLPSPLHLSFFSSSSPNFPPQLSSLALS